VSGKRKAPLAPSSLTSLVDVLFILVFAALVQRASAATGAQVPDEDVATKVKATGAAVGAPVAQAAPRPAHSEALRRAAISTLATELEERPAIIARVAKSGVLTKLEAPGLASADAAAGAGGGSGEGGLVLELPLVEPVSDPDVAIGYVGDRDASKRLCAVIASRLAAAGSAVALERSLVVIAVDTPVRELTVALVGGLRRDVADCLAVHRAAAVLLDPTATAATAIDQPQSQPQPTEQ
jgi:hypothetical protein